MDRAAHDAKVNAFSESYRIAVEDHKAAHVAQTVALDAVYEAQCAIANARHVLELMRAGYDIAWRARDEFDRHGYNIKT